MARVSSIVGIVVGGALLPCAGAAWAHDVTIDGSAAEWSTRLPPSANLGVVARDAAEHGELVWLDASGDTRDDLHGGTADAAADLRAVRITASATGLHVLLQFEGATVPEVQAQIAIDTDGVPGSGASAFANGADTKVSPAAAWEYLVYTRFASGAAPRVVDQALVDRGTATAARSGAFEELSIPWARLGLSAPPTSRLRFSIATFRTGPTDQTLDIGGPTVSNAIDVVTNHGDPRATGFLGTIDEVSDGTLDHFLDAWLDANGEVYAPLIVTRFVSSSSTTTGGSELVWLRNRTPSPLSLAGFKLGDAATPDSTSEGMLSLPSTVLPAGSVFVAAQHGANYAARFGAAPDAEWTPTDATIADLASYAKWATGSVALANAGDQILVLDPSDTVVDVVTYGTGTYAGVAPVAAPGADVQLVRDGVDRDRDDCALDFSDLSDASDAGACTDACAGDGGLDGATDGALGDAASDAMDEAAADAGGDGTVEDATAEDAAVDDSAGEDATIEDTATEDTATEDTAIEDAENEAGEDATVDTGTRGPWISTNSPDRRLGETNSNAGNGCACAVPGGPGRTPRFLPIALAALAVTMARRGRRKR